MSLEEQTQRPGGLNREGVVADLNAASHGTDTPSIGHVYLCLARALTKRSSLQTLRGAGGMTHRYNLALIKR